MSLGVNLSSPDIRTGYDAVLDGKKDYMVLTYEKASNDLRVQVLEKGDLDYLSEEFSDGRIQYAFARVIDPNSKLPKFVLINWCGEGVPENRKGLFASHSTAVAQFLKGYHVSIQARSEGDIDPALIMKRVMASLATTRRRALHKYVDVAFLIFVFQIAYPFPHLLLLLINNTLT